MSFNSIHGIFVKTLPYSDNAQIATLFTDERGIVDVFVKRSNAKSAGGDAVITPLNEVEMTLREGRGELWYCQECRLMEGFLGLRSSLSALQGGIELLRAVHLSQLKERPAPLIYALLKNYLGRLEQGEVSWKITTSFYLKLLRHEGLWIDEKTDEVVFEKEEWDTCFLLAHCTRRSDLEAVFCSQPDQLLCKIRQLFEVRLA